MNYCKFLEIPSQSPIGRKKNPLEKSKLSSFKKLELVLILILFLDVETRNKAPEQFDSPLSAKEENNNEPNKSFPLQVAVSYHE